MQSDAVGTLTASFDVRYEGERLCGRFGTKQTEKIPVPHRVKGSCAAALRKMSRRAASANHPSDFSAFFFFFLSAQNRNMSLLSSAPSMRIIIQKYSHKNRITIAARLPYTYDALGK